MTEPIIRPIKKKDNKQIAQVIRTVLFELGVPRVGTVYEDSNLDCMFETFQKERAGYFVVTENGQIVGGGGVAHLDNYEGNVCELQKMYFLPTVRGRGIGTLMIDRCLEIAREFDYERCYLETMPYMKAAQKLYRKYGFEALHSPMGDTGHYACGVYMIKDL
jgi:putative acetyltransferase